jgi:hypothetical protein
LIDITNLETVIDGAENVIIITEKNGEVHLSFNQELDQMEVLDLLALVTSQFYEVADDGGNSIH